MEEKIKSIISGFINFSAEQISVDTVIDRSSVSSSITLHRMYAKLAEEGIVVEDYVSVKKFGDLLQRVNGNGPAAFTAPGDVKATNNYVSTNEAGYSVGIDIEQVAAMPGTNDFRESEFYKMNFSSSEIAYCILQPDPYASFAGLFAAKEAIVKANNTNGKKPFNAIVIDHQANGRPTYSGFYLSISHTGDLAVAVALQIAPTSINKTQDQVVRQQSNASYNKAVWLFLISFLISLVALFVALQK